MVIDVTNMGATLFLPSGLDHKVTEDLREGSKHDPAEERRRDRLRDDQPLHKYSERTER